MKYLLLASTLALAACAQPASQSILATAPNAAVPATQAGCHIFHRGVKRAKILRKGHWTFFATQPKAEFTVMRVTNGFQTASITADPTSDTDGSELVTIAPQDNSGVVYISPSKGIRVTLGSGDPGYAGAGVILAARSCNEGS